MTPLWAVLVPLATAVSTTVRVPPMLFRTASRGFFSIKGTCL